ncbi:MAG: ParB N-terminal domain-containing protein [Planctomycetes bacterium]|nr:ParB N-terminal domain-containing protein [Planctomycetota bacterium]
MNEFDSFSSSVEHLHPSPENDEIYGVVDTTANEFIDFANDIARNGIREPIVVSADGYLISGHRRFAAAKLVGMQEVPVRWITDLYRSNHTSTEWKRQLVSYNQQRVKSATVRLREAALQVDPDIAYQQLCFERDQQHSRGLKKLEVTGKKHRAKISDGKREMLQAAITVIESLKKFWPVSVRQVHYGLLNNPPWKNTNAKKKRRRYKNIDEDYSDLTDLLARARISGLVDWEAITDETRPITNTSFHKDSAEFFSDAFYGFLRGYHRDLLQSQLDHVELIVEKMTVQNIILPIAQKYRVPMTAGRGYCSVIPRKEMVDRFHRSGKRKLILLICSDFDPEGDDIAESMVRSIRDDFKVEDIEASKILLRQDQIKDWNLPPNEEEAKESSSRFEKFVAKYGSRQVFELESISPLVMQAAVAKGIRSAIDIEAFEQEVQAERQDAVQLSAMKLSAAEFFENPGMSGLDA